MVPGWFQDGLRMTPEDSPRMAPGVWLAEGWPQDGSKMAGRRGRTSPASSGHSGVVLGGPGKLIHQIMVRFLIS